MAASSRNRNSRAYREYDRSYARTYIDGNVVRRVEAVPERRVERRPAQEQHRRTNNRINRNREKALRINMPYVVFLTVATVMTVAFCVYFLKLQAEGITYRNEIANLEGRLSTMKLANDNAYEDALFSVNMEEVKEIAIKDLGMTYAGEGQVITYNSQNGDYIRQYGEIPTE